MERFYSECVFVNEHNNVLDAFSLDVEEGSRYLIGKYVRPDMKVLELGARYGTVSVCLDYILENPKEQLLCVDPDRKIKECLNKNKENLGPLNRLCSETSSSCLFNNLGP